MIKICMNQVEFEYDIQGLARSFFPGMSMVTNKDVDADVTVTVCYQPDTIEARVETKEGKEATGTCEALPDDRIETKNKLKRLLYGLFQECTGKTLPWGALTGIRPTKIPMAMIEQGMGRSRIISEMKRIYLLSEKKANEACDIAETEYSLLKRIDYREGYSLYIGIPFCPSTCLYCSFTSYPIASYKGKVDAYLDALMRELDYLAKEFHNRTLQTVYIGGGTPTTLTPEQLRRLIRGVKERFDVGSLMEFTVEAGRPDSITPEKLAVLKEEGVTRISINPQTMQDKTLKLIGRHHTVDDIVRTYHMAREAGFDNINMDLIVGLPGETEEDVRDTLRQICELKPDSLTVHSLALKRASRLNIMRQAYEEYRSENSVAIMELVAEAAKSLGLHPYYLYRQKNMAGNLENVGYAVPGKECLYNVLIMEEKHTIAAAGAGASTKYVHANGTLIERAENVKNVDQYIERIDEMIERKKHLFWKDITPRDRMLYEQLAHEATVSNLAVAVAKEMGLDDAFVHDVAIAGMYHDVGKRDLIPFILEESDNHHTFEIEKARRLREHAELGYHIMLEKGFSETIAEAVRHHHENFDGSGYPENRFGENIPLASRILRVCDVYAALITDRWYRKAYSPEEAMKIMIEENNIYDMQVFLAMMRVYEKSERSDYEVRLEDVLCLPPDEEGGKV